jgi:hypothetical protein
MIPLIKTRLESGSWVHGTIVKTLDFPDDGRTDIPIGTTGFVRASSTTICAVDFSRNGFPYDTGVVYGNYKLEAS